MLKSVLSPTSPFKEQFKVEEEPIEPMVESHHISHQTAISSSLPLKKLKMLRKLETKKVSD
jgi:hypothetical protein